ncbi:hypothetical protein CTI16_04020 [Prevotella intermedia]|uniref:Tox-REase-2 domain-containing protein n=1 Tax=Prevotella intermedia TaxID=28131 RepID=A0AAJ3RJ84_PREIN|nr:hypothetical protein CUB95_11765 [Prevotella intermedia]PIK18307.1 hypothetical protein CTI16_04020 [Prevotella intermedia]
MLFILHKWTPIEELDVNDTLQLKDNSIVVIENKIIFPTFVEVYNLEIEDNENYYVTEEGILVHNRYKDELKTRNNVAQGEAGTYQSKTCGDTEFLIEGNGEKVWADGIDEVTNHAQDAKYVGDVHKSPYVENSSAPEFLQIKIEDELERYSKVINADDNPLEGLEIITNTEESAKYFQKLLDKFGVNGKITIKK